jgi:hypothetical protein
MQFANLYSVDGNYKQLTTKIAPGKELRSIKDIKRLMGQNEDKKVAGDGYVTAILKKVVDKTIATNLFVCAYDSLISTYPEVVRTLDKSNSNAFTNFRNNSKSLSGKELAQARTVLKLGKVKIEAKQFSDLLSGLYEKAGYTLNKKK